MTSAEREIFWNTLCALPGLDPKQDAEKLITTIKYPKLLFRYRPVSFSSLGALRTNKLYFSSANYYDDPFDTFLHIDIEAIKQEFLSAFETPESTEKVAEGVKTVLGNMLTEEQKALFTPNAITKMVSNGLVENFLNITLGLRDGIWNKERHVVYLLF